MKIVILTNNSWGLYIFRHKLISALIKKGYEITAFTPFDGCVEELTKLGITLVETPIDRRGKNPISDFFLLKLYYKALKHETPDLTITYTIKPNVYGGIACRLLNTPYVANITGLGSAFEKKGLLRVIAITLNKIALKNVKLVFFENNESREIFIHEKIVKREKTKVLQGAGVDLDHFVYRSYPNNECFHFLFIGRIMKEKGIDELLEAMRKLINDGENCILDVVGPYEENYEEKFMIYESENWLKYYGYQDDVRPFIAKCNCFVLPSYHEGMANTNLECAASGRPIITSDIPGCREAVIDGISGYLCKPRNIDSLYLAMKKMIIANNKAEMGINGRRHMEQEFDKRRVVENTIEELFL